jgi:hypothetical protein
MLARPRLPRPVVVDLAAQQKLPDPVPGAHQIHANVLAAAHQIAQLLALDRRDRHQRQLAGRQQPGQADRVALIRLDPIRRRALGLARRAHPELDPLRASTARESIAGRARLIHHPSRPLHTTQPWQQLVRAADHPPGRDLARRLIKDRDRRLARDPRRSERSWLPGLLSEAGRSVDRARLAFCHESEALVTTIRGAPSRARDPEVP